MAEIALFDDHNSPITQGLLAKFIRCRKETRLFLEGVTPRRSARHFIYGDLAHRVLERTYRHARKNPGRWTPKRVLRGDLDDLVDRTLTSESRAVAKENKLNWGANESIALAEDTATLRGLLPEYFRQWAHDDFGVNSQWQEPEQKFDLRIGKMHLAGKIDGAVWLSRQLWLFETKTFSQVNEKSFMTLLWRDLQVNFYSLALREIIGYFPEGVMYNILRKPSIKRRTAETYPQWTKRVRLDAKARPSFYFHRYEVPLAKKALQRFERELQLTVAEFVAWRAAGMPVRLFGMPCETKYGMCHMAGWCHNGAKYEYEKRKVLYPELA